MPTSEFEREAVKQAVEALIAKRRPPEHLRERVDLAYTFEGSEVIIFSIRPRFDDRSVIIHEQVARAKFVKARKRWKVYWMRADMKWHLYPPKSEVTRIDDFLAEVDRDSHGCFWG